MTTIELLKSFGLSDYEAEVYGALIKVERAKVQEILKMVSVPRPMIYFTLKKLVNKGLCSEIKGKVNQYSAVAPAIAFQDILQSKIKWLGKLNEVYKKREKGKVPIEFVEVLKGRQIKEFLKRVVKEAEKEILVFFKFPTKKNEKELEDATKLEIRALRKGIKVRCLYDEKCLNDNQILPYLNKLLNAGEKAKVYSLPMNMLVADDKVATFSLTHHGEDDVTVFVFNHPALISVMKDAFEYCWAKGTDINKVITKVAGTFQSRQIGVKNPSYYQ